MYTDSLFTNLAEELFSSFAPSSAKLFIDDENSEIVFSVDLPGFTKEEIEIDLFGEKLTIKAENKKRKFEKTYLLNVISMGIGKKYIMTSKHANPSYENGVLEIRFPKVKQEFSRIKFS